MKVSGVGYGTGKMCSVFGYWRGESTLRATFFLSISTYLSIGPGNDENEPCFSCRGVTVFQILVTQLTKRVRRVMDEHELLGLPTYLQ